MAINKNCQTLNFSAKVIFPIKKGGIEVKRKNNAIPKKHFSLSL